jgi:translation elongation factor EF-G
MLVADQLVGVAAVPLNVTVLVPRVAPKLVPAIVTAVPTGPLAGDRLVNVGALVTVYGSALLARPPTVTTTLPVVAPVGTGTAMLVADQLVGVAAVPLNVTVLVPRVAPKLVPAIVTAVPTGPLAGVRLVSVGAAVTV